MTPIHAWQNGNRHDWNIKDKKYTRTLPITVKATKNVQVGYDVSALNTHFDATWSQKSTNLNFILLRLGVGHDGMRRVDSRAIALKQNKVKMGAYWYLASIDRKVS